MIRESCFALCEALFTVTFESYSRSCCLEKGTVFSSGLSSIVTAKSLEVIYQSCFSECRSLKIVPLEPDLRLYDVEHTYFSGSGLQSIDLNSLWEVI
jgi:hypothetical protein